VRVRSRGSATSQENARVFFPTASPSILRRSTRDGPLDNVTAEEEERGPVAVLRTRGSKYTKPTRTRIRRGRSAIRFSRLRSRIDRLARQRAGSSLLFLVAGLLPRTRSFAINGISKRESDARLFSRGRERGRVAQRRRPRCARGEWRGD